MGRKGQLSLCAAREGTGGHRSLACCPRKYPEDVGKDHSRDAELPSPACLFLTASALKIRREEIAKRDGKDEMNLKRQLQAVSWPQLYLKYQKITLSLWSVNNLLWLGFNFCHWGMDNRTCFPQRAQATVFIAVHRKGPEERVCRILSRGVCLLRRRYLSAL